MVDNFFRVERCIQERTKPGDRFVVGVVGPPAAGKSTFAKALELHLNRGQDGVARTLGIDAYHIPNRRLQQLALVTRKGAPETYDVNRLIATLRSLTTKPYQAVQTPIYSRELHEPIENAQTVLPTHRFLILEGNYLLLNQAPWNTIPELVHLFVILDLPNSTLEERLLRRHLSGGRAESQARLKIRSDMKNADLVRESITSTSIQIPRILIDSSDIT